MKNKNIKLLLLLFSFFLLSGFTVFDKTEKKEDFFTIFKKSDNYKIKKGILGDPATVPETFDLRDVDGESYVPGVKDRQDLNMSMYFAINTAIESNMLMHEQGSVNFSENYLDYLRIADGLDEDFNSQYLLNQYGEDPGNHNILPRLAAGYGPMTETEFGDPYLTEFKAKPLNELIKFDNMQYLVPDILEVPPYYYHIKENTIEDTKTEIREQVALRVQIIKEHLMNEGALYADFTIDPDAYISEKNMYYSEDDEIPNTNYAVNIIGWDNTKTITDSYGNEFVGAWLVQDNNGSDTEDNPIFYVSYFETRIYENVIGINKVIERTPNSFVRHYNEHYSATNESVFYYSKTKNYDEKLNYAVAYIDELASTTGTLKVYKATLNGEEYTTDTSTVLATITDIPLHTGYVYIDLNELAINSEHYALVSSFHIENMYTNYSTTVTNKYIKINPYSTYHYEEVLKNYSGGQIFNLLDSYNIQSGTSYTLELFNDKGEDVTEYMKVSDFPFGGIGNGTDATRFLLKQTINETEYVDLKITIDGVSDTRRIPVYNFEIDGVGTEEEPYIIDEAKDFIVMQNSFGYFELANDIDMQPATRNKNGYFYGVSDHGYYDAEELKEYYGTTNVSWNMSMSFAGTLDGKGHTIYNFYSNTGPFFDVLAGATIKNVKLKNFEVDIKAGSDGLASILAYNTYNQYFGPVTLANIEITDSKATDLSGGAYLIASSIDDISEFNMNNCKFSNNTMSSTYDAALIGSIYNYSSYGPCKTNINISNNIMSNNLIKTTREDSDRGYFVAYSSNSLDKAKPDKYGQINIKNNYYEPYTVSTPETGMFYPTELVGSYYYNITDSSDPTYEKNPEDAKLDVSANVLLDSENKLLQTTYSTLDFENTWNLKTDQIPSLKIFDPDESIPELEVSYKEKEITDENSCVFDEGYTATSILEDVDAPTGSQIIFFDSAGNKMSATSKIGTGVLMVVSSNKSTSSTYLVVPGDVTGDGLVTVTDVMKTADSALLDDQTELLNNEYEGIAMDVTYDDRINVADVSKIADHAIDGTISLLEPVLPE